MWSYGIQKYWRQLQKVSMKFKYIYFLILLSGCSQTESLSKSVMNQGNCATLAGDKAYIKNGEIRLRADNYLLGTIEIISKTEIKVTDDTNITQTLRLAVDQRNDKTLLYASTADRNVPFACGLN